MALLDGGSPKPSSAMNDMDPQIHHEHQPREKVPAAEWSGKWQADRAPAVPVQDPRDQHIQRDQGENEVRRCEPQPSPNICACVRKLCGQPGDSSTSLEEVHDHQGDERETNIGVNRNANV